MGNAVFTILNMSHILYLLVLAVVRLKTIGPHWTELTDGLHVIQDKRSMAFIELKVGIQVGRIFNIEFHFLVIESICQNVC